MLLGFMLSCSYSSDKSVYSYKETVELYATIQFMVRSEQFKTILDKYNMLKYENQIKYGARSLSKINSPAKWKKFLQDSINFFITLEKKYVVKYYQPRGYEKKYNTFNDNYLVDLKKTLSQTYWKVSYSATKWPQRFVLIKELYTNGKLTQQAFYDELRYKLKEEYFDTKGSTKTTYYHSNIKIN